MTREGLNLDCYCLGLILFRVAMSGGLHGWPCNVAVAAPVPTQAWAKAGVGHGMGCCGLQAGLDAIAEIGIAEGGGVGLESEGDEVVLMKKIGDGLQITVALQRLQRR